MKGNTIPETLEIEVFKAGDYGPRGQFNEADLETMARDYDREVHEAPVTLDHQRSGAALGWVSSLRRVGDRLFATIEKISPTLAELLQSGAYKKRSIDLYRSLRETGRPYVKAVSFLGAGTPVVKGLADPVFSEEGEKTWRFSEEFASENEEGTEQTLAPRKPDRAAAARARERLIGANRWDPKWEDGGLMGAFAELGDGEALDALLDVLMRKESPVSFGECATHRPPMFDGEADEFVGTPSPDSVRRHQDALAFMAQHPTASYAEALLRTAR